MSKLEAVDNNHLYKSINFKSAELLLEEVLKMLNVMINKLENSNTIS